MVCFVTDTMDLCYQHRLLHLSNNRIERYVSLRFCGIKSSAIPKESITPGEDPNIFVVQSQQSRRDVFTQLICTLMSFSN